MEDWLDRWKDQQRAAETQEATRRLAGRAEREIAAQSRRQERLEAAVAGTLYRWRDTVTHEIVYIGQTTAEHWQSRAYAHMRADWYSAGRMRLETAQIQPPASLLVLAHEPELIHFYHPRYNVDCRGCALRLPRELRDEVAQHEWKRR